MTDTLLTPELQEKFAVLWTAGVFGVTDGKVTLHFKGGFIQGVQVEAWSYQRRAELSTPSVVHKKHIP